MTWEQPTALWLLLAILLLLFARRTSPRQRLAIANLFLWENLESRNAAALSKRLRQHWLVILQAAFVTVVVIALARPLLSFGSKHVAIVLDVSMSMGARDGSTTRLEAAKAHTVALVRGLPRGTEARIWLAGSSVRALGPFTRSDATLGRVLQPIRSTDAGADLEAAIEQARTSDPKISRVYVVSDATALQSRQGVTWISVGTRADNTAITILEARRNPDETVALLLGVRNYGSASVTTDVVITDEASVLRRRTLGLPAGRESNVVFELPDLEGIVIARLDGSDALEADNVRFTIVPSARPLRALLVGRNHFVEQAIAALPGVTTINSHTPEDATDDEPDLVICGSCEDLPNANPRAGILLLPPSQAPALEPSPIVLADASHGLLRHLNADGALVSPLNPNRDVGGGAVLAYAATLPVIVAHERDNRRVVELRFDPTASAITGEVTFPLLIANAVEWLTAPQRRPPVLVAGEPLRQVLPALGGNEIVIRAPDDRRISVRLAGAELIVADTAVAGISRATWSDGTFEFVVNPAVEESDLSQGPLQAASPSAGALDVQTSPTGLTNGLLITALGLLALEWRHRAGGRGR